MTKEYSWSPNKKTDRNKKIAELFKKKISVRAIGRIFKISHTRVKQILDSEKTPCG